MRYNNVSVMRKSKPLKQANRIHHRKQAKKRFSPVRRALGFLPALLLFSASASLHYSSASHYNPARSSVLSYATSISGADLLAQTNSQRSGNGVAGLSLNGQLNSAAQTKANDMVTRNYWSHTTPDGEQPWVFIANAGYQYQTAGENLAYGFATSADTVTGWMNSPPHRDNLLNSAFIEVGFGFADSPDFVNDGQQTVVVAMYGAPLAQPAAPVNVVSSPPPAPQQTTPADTAPSAAPSTEAIQSPAAPVATAPTETAKNDPSVKKAETEKQPSTPKAGIASVRRIQLLTGGNARWSSTLLATSIFGVGLFWVFERGRQIKHLALAGEHFLLKHIHIDLAVVGFIFLGFTLLQTSGLVR